MLSGFDGESNLKNGASSQRNEIREFKGPALEMDAQEMMNMDVQSCCESQLIVRYSHMAQEPNTGGCKTFETAQ